jgi:cobyric acid synthase
MTIFISHHRNNYNQMAKHLMILGTASHVGKSVLAAAFCHIFSKTAPTAPFKAQNMSLNSWITRDGGVVGCVFARLRDQDTTQVQRLPPQVSNI